jgi:hypothetical protein
MKAFEFVETFRSRMNELYLDKSIYNVINEHMDELKKKITFQYGCVVVWDGGLDIPDTSDYVDVIKYGDVVVEHEEYVDGAYTGTSYNYYVVSPNVHGVDEAYVLRLLSKNEKALELFCKEYNVDFLKACYTLDCPSSKLNEVKEKIIEEIESSERHL